MDVIKNRLPAAVVLVALLVYGLTLSQGTSLNNLPLAGNVAGWDRQATLTQPLTWLVTLPLKLLPAAWIPVGLNFIFALCGALTLGLLARSVELLPWNLPPVAKARWSKFLPGALACGVCGLEYNFWLEATAGGGAMLNQLLLAAVVWCLLEYRAGKQPRWLGAATGLWGFGLAQSWVMLFNLPLFVAALIWLRGWRSLKWGFSRRMLLLGLAGFSIFALLPLVNGLNPHSPFSFGGAWVATSKATISTLLQIYIEFWARHRLMTLVLVLFFLAPALSAWLCSQDDGTGNKSKVDQLQIWIYRAVRVALLLACLWLAFEPRLGPHQILLQHFQVSMPLLTFDYFNALGIAFLVGNLLMLSQVRSAGRPRGGVQKIIFWARPKVPVLLCALSVLTLFGLAMRNAPPIWAESRQPLEHFGGLAARSLPSGGGILFGDDARKLVAVQAALERQPEGRRWLAVDLVALPSPSYRAALERQQPLGWVSGAAHHRLGPVELMQLLEQLAQTNRLFFLQPAPGQVWFEQFYPQPFEAVAELKKYESGREATMAPLTGQALDASEIFWDKAWQQRIADLQPLTSTHPRKGSGWRAKISDRLYLPPVPVPQTSLFRQWYSIWLNDWGVSLQRSGRWPAAQGRFEQALAVNTNNWAAAVNLQCNQNLQAGRPLNLAGLPGLARRFENWERLAQITIDYGAFDEPSLCFLLGRAYQQIGWPRQAVQQLERATALVPGGLEPAFALAEIYLQYRQSDQVFALVKRLRPFLNGLPADQSEPLATDLDFLEAKAWMSQTNTAQAHRILQSVLEKHAGNAATANRVLNAYVSFGDLTHALELVTRELAEAPDHPLGLNLQAALLIQMNQPAAAIPILQRAIGITNSPSFRLNLALAYLKNENLAEAETEYHRLENEPTLSLTAQIGLASVAERRHDTNLAIHRLEMCFTNSRPGSLDREEIRARLDALGKNAPPASAAK
jgi:tetratricopeptide (TPR) repeat protein